MYDTDTFGCRHGPNHKVSSISVHCQWAQPARLLSSCASAAARSLTGLAGIDSGVHLSIAFCCVWATTSLTCFHGWLLQSGYGTLIDYMLETIRSLFLCSVFVCVCVRLCLCVCVCVCVCVHVFGFQGHVIQPLQPFSHVLLDQR